MSYFGMGDLPTTKWCSERNPQGRCLPRPGNICLPMDTGALAIFRDLQRQANRVAEVRGFRKVNEDGRIGPETVKLVEEVTSASYGFCDQVAAIADSLAATIRGTADALGAPAMVSAPVTRPPLKPQPDGSIVDPEVSGFGAGFGGLGWVGWALVAGAGYLVWEDYSKRQKR